MLTINGSRLLVVFGGDVWELQDTIHDWHLIRHGVNVSMAKLITGWVENVPVEETFVQFQGRLKKMDNERAVLDVSKSK